MSPDVLTPEALDAILAETEEVLADPEAVVAFLRCSECRAALTARMDT